MWSGRGEDGVSGATGRVLRGLGGERTEYGTGSDGHTPGLVRLELLPVLLSVLVVPSSRPDHRLSGAACAGIPGISHFISIPATL